MKKTSALTLALLAAAGLAGAQHQHDGNCHQVRRGVQSLMIFIDENGNPRTPSDEEVRALAADAAKSLGAPEEDISKETGMPLLYLQGRAAAETPGKIVATVKSADKALPSTINIVSTDGPGEGTNDATVVSPVGGNPGTTRGAQRINAMVNAAQFWANKLDTPIQIDVSVNWAALSCSAFSGTLGSAGPTAVVALGPGFPNTNAAHPIALADALVAADIFGTPSIAEISASFNSSLDDPGLDASCLTGVEWYYGYDGNPPSGDVDFYDTFLHELGHGLGFLTFVDLTDGSRVNISGTDYDDHFMINLFDETTDEFWWQMTDGERVTSAINNGNLTWGGASVTNYVTANPAYLSAGRHVDGRVRMYAPGSLVSGSSVSHFDEALVPHELMEPISDPSPDDVLTQNLMIDIGWTGALPVELDVYDVE